MIRLMIMLRHVLCGRVVATKRNTAGLTGTQVQPFAMMLYAFFANMVGANFYFGNCLKV